MTDDMWHENIINDINDINGMRHVTWRRHYVKWWRHHMMQMTFTTLRYATNTWSHDVHHITWSRDVTDVCQVTLWRHHVIDVVYIASRDVNDVRYVNRWCHHVIYVTSLISGLQYILSLTIVPIDNCTHCVCRKRCYRCKKGGAGASMVLQMQESYYRCMEAY